MKAAVYAKARSGRVLRIMDLEQPVPKDNEVLVQVCAASVNPLDWRMKRPRPGVDVAGRVVTVGRAVTHFKPGDAVFGAGRGTFAEYACAAEANIAAKPESLTFEQAAAMPIAGLTALQGLRDKGGLHPGQKVLINGAAGGIGTFAVQIAKSLAPRLPVFAAPRTSNWCFPSVPTRSWTIHARISPRAASVTICFSTMWETARCQASSAF
jgi:NADPH:quinone reductase-like Zn-dependent oxidoreductase